MSIELELELLVKLTFALVVGLLIGIDRELKHKPLGVRTSMVICVASCLITIVSIESAYTFPKNEFMVMDPLRLAAQIVSGIGFVGAGVILRRNNDVISGLTTAAMIWASGGLGIAIGAGFYEESAYSVLLFILAVNLFPNVLRRLGLKKLGDYDLSIRIVVSPACSLSGMLECIAYNRGRSPDSEGEPDKKRKKPVSDIRNLRIKDLDDGNGLVTMTITAKEQHSAAQYYSMIKKLDHVISVEIEHL